MQKMFLIMSKQEVCFFYCSHDLLATIVQLYTSLGYQGPGIVADIKNELTNTLQRDGMNFGQLIGSDHKKENAV